MGVKGRNYDELTRAIIDNDDIDNDDGWREEALAMQIGT